MSEWQDISTAQRVPTSRILAAVPTQEGGKYVLILRWFKYNGLEAWRDQDGDPHKPTHWQPLPSPPES
jgi:hypothetical protein